MQRKCRNTPPTVARQLRREANFGCALCGCPILENAHIIPYETSHAFPPQDMVALCPTCHVRADLGRYSETFLRHTKANPHNRTHVQDLFLIENDHLMVHLGANRYRDIPRLIVVNDFDIISIHKDDENFPLLNVNFFDAYNNLIGMIIDSYWHVDRALVWDLVYKPQHLTIRNAPRRIALDVSIENGEVFIVGDLHYIGHPITITRDGVWMGGIMIGTGITNSTFTNLDVAIYQQLSP